MRTKTWVMTVEKNSDEFLEQQNKLQQVRQSVILLNRHSTKKHYVKWQGWGVRTLVAIADGKHPRAYDQALPLSKATSYDVYIYQR